MLTDYCVTADVDGEDTHKKFCIWLTTQPCASIPLDLLQSVYKLAYDSLQKLTEPAPAAQQQQEGEGDKQEEKEVIFPSGALQGILVSCKYFKKHVSFYALDMHISISRTVAC